MPKLVVTFSSTNNICI